MIFDPAGIVQCLRQYAAESLEQLDLGVYEYSQMEHSQDALFQGAEEKRYVGTLRMFKALTTVFIDDQYFSNPNFNTGN